jgi:hypothetical protein
MMNMSGCYRGVSWQRHYWGLELWSIPNGSDRLICRKYVGNGIDRVLVRESVNSYLADLAGC